MSLAYVYTRARQGIEAPLVTVEVHLSNGLPSLNIVGLPETAVRESKDRVRSALINAHFEFPPRRITISLAPADLPKEGSRFDLAIALGILAASRQVPAESLRQFEFIGELALSGELRPVDGVLPSAIACGTGGRSLIVSTANATEAAVASQCQVLAADHLLSVCAHLRDNQSLPMHPAPPVDNKPPATDLADIIGQHQAKRALEVAAAGNHNLLLSGPPGTGKTMLASRLPEILPRLTEPEALEVAAIHSVAGFGLRKDFRQPPFRSPHHTASGIALVGGGSNSQPGEISLAHNGILFLDELPEFSRKVLEMLRQPLESGEVHITRVLARNVYPAAFILVAAMNPCPCGYLGTERCRCSPDMIRRYQNKISGPLLDRIDLQVNVPPLPKYQLTRANRPGENSATIKARVQRAREWQLHRQGKVNARLTPEELQRFCRLDKEQQLLLETAIERLRLSARAYHRVLKVARTLADLNESREISTQHLTEALGYRLPDQRAY